jgi:DNA helicase-2/ATP-dependent DNA helicase PcrA
MENLNPMGSAVGTGWSRSYSPGMGSGYGGARRQGRKGDGGESHYKYEDENQEKVGEGNSIDNIAKFFGGSKAMAARAVHSGGASAAKSSETGFKKGARVRHSKYGEGTVLSCEGSGEDTKLTIYFNGHGVKKLMEKFANLQKA